MPLRQNAIRVGVTPKSRESSSLRSPRDSSDQSRLWIKVQELSSAVQSMAYTQRRMQEEINRLRIYKPASSPATASGPLKMCQITTALSGLDYLTVTPYDGSATYGSPFQVAKDLITRPSITADTVDGVSLTYNYSGTVGSVTLNDNHRTSYDGTTTEVEVCYRRYVLNGLIWVMPCDYSGVTYSGSDLKFIEVKPARVWARMYAT